MYRHDRKRKHVRFCPLHRNVFTMGFFYMSLIITSISVDFKFEINCDKCSCFSRTLYSCAIIFHNCVIAQDNDYI